MSTINWINYFSYINPFSENFHATQKFKEIEKTWEKIKIITLTALAALASLPFLGLGGLAVFRLMVCKYTNIKNTSPSTNTIDLDTLKKIPSQDSTNGNPSNKTAEVPEKLTEKEKLAEAKVSEEATEKEELAEEESSEEVTKEEGSTDDESGEFPIDQNSLIELNKIYAFNEPNQSVYLGFGGKKIHPLNLLYLRDLKKSFEFHES